MANHKDAYKSVMGELKERISKHGSSRLDKKSEHHEPDGDEDAEGREPNEDGFEIESAEECALCGNKHNPKDEC